MYGWCGYYGSCILVSYEEEAAFVMMQDRRKKYDQVRFWFYGGSGTASTGCVTFVKWNMS